MDSKMLVDSHEVLKLVVVVVLAVVLAVLAQEQRPFQIVVAVAQERPSLDESKRFFRWLSPNNRCDHRRETLQLTTREEVYSIRWFCRMEEEVVVVRWMDKERTVVQLS
jgi:hypothetical protein